MLKSLIKTIFVAGAILYGNAMFAQMTYTDLVDINRMHKGVSGLRSMQDGEHYTINKHGAIIRQSYANAEVCDTIYKGRFASYELAFGRRFPFLCSVESSTLT